MKTALVNEFIEKNGTEWSVSFDGYNTSDISQTVICLNSEEAFKLKKIVDDLKEKLAFCVDNLDYRLEENYEFDANLDIILTDIKALYL